MAFSSMTNFLLKKISFRFNRKEIFIRPEAVNYCNPNFFFTNGNTSSAVSAVKSNAPVS